jgi:L-ribulose-5-phosphate 4-epimerase
VSGIDRDRNIVAIKPSGVAYDDLRVDDIVVVNGNGDIVEGTLRPSSDTKTHLLLYRHFTGIGGIAHTHSVHATSWAQARRAIPILGTTHADLLPVDVPCTDMMTARAIRGDYEVETGNQILRAFARRSYEEIPMVLVAGHAPFTWGESPEQAVYHSLMLEQLATMALLTLRVNPRIPRLPRALIEKHHRRKHGPDSYYGQETPRP